MGSLKQQPKLPVIDFFKETMKPGTSSWLSTSKIVRQSLEEYGCFLAVLHKEATQELHETMFEQLKELFDLPLETKAKNTSDILGFGYAGNFKKLLVEYFGMENGATLETTQSFTNLMWPAGNDFFCKTAFSYSKLLSESYHVVMKMVFENYGVVDKSSSDSFIQSASFLLRYLKYRAPQINETINTGLPYHTDKDFLTVLETNQVQGLEIKTKEGEWITYKPSPSTFLVLAGEAFTAWSNGRVYAPLHGVVMRSGNEVRYSIGLFSFMRETVQTPDELVDEEHPLQFKPFDHFSFLRFCGEEEGKNAKCAIKAYCGV